VVSNDESHLGIGVDKAHLVDSAAVLGLHPVRLTAS
jgi:hypothetical protein